MVQISLLLLRLQMQRVCECSGTTSLRLYLSFLKDFVRGELRKGEEDPCGPHDPAAPPSDGLVEDLADNTPALWSSSDSRRTLLLHALRGAQEAAEAEAGADAALEHCAWIEDLLQVFYSKHSSIT